MKKIGTEREEHQNAPQHGGEARHREALRGVARLHVRGLVRHHHGELVVRLADLQQALAHEDLPPRQDKRVDLVVVLAVELPLRLPLRPFLPTAVVAVKLRRLFIVKSTFVSIKSSF